ncbi:MAG: penicillin-binding protein [Clostridia bacterium]|nr:penicillin-binding protein [Clostridia bacterium]
MSKPFKWFCFAMSVVIFLSAVLLATTPNDFIETVDDIVGSEEVVTNIRNYELNMTTIVYAQNDEGVWEEYQRLHGEENRIWVDIKEVPQEMIDAFIAIEDQRFYEHDGVDWKRTLSAFLNYLPFVKLYKSNQGGSTITQQLIKNITDDRSKSITRKVREIARALAVERKLTKEKILEAYLNTISLGNGICGVQVAANYYFNKDVSKLSLAECASIAAITKNPVKYNPDTSPEANEKRRKSVLDKMLDLGKISEKEYKKAVESKVVVDKSQQSHFEIPINNYFIDTMIGDVSADLAEKKGITEDAATRLLYNGGYKIYATIDRKIQDKIEEVFNDKDTYFPLKSREDSEVSMQGAMTVLDYDGSIKGIVGGAGEKTINRGLNRAIDSPRQPGSTMKPLGVYALAIDRGILGYSSVVEDKPVANYYTWGQSGPREWYGKYEGWISVRRAIAHSANTIPVKYINQVGLEESYSFLKYDLNLSFLDEGDINPASLAIGGCQYGITTTQSAAAYSIFGNHGVFNQPKTYMKVLGLNGETELERSEGRQVLKPEAADIMNKLLQGVIYDTGGTGGALAGYSGMRAFAKTGTSSEANDSWVVGGSPYYIASVWCGFDKPENMWNTRYASTIWRTVMTDVHKGLEYKSFEMTGKYYMAKFCTNTGFRAGSSCKDTEYGYCVPGVYYKYCNGVHHKNEDEEDEDSDDSSSSKKKKSEKKDSKSDKKTSSKNKDSSSGKKDSSSSKRNSSSGKSSSTSSKNNSTEHDVSSSTVSSEKSTVSSTPSTVSSTPSTVSSTPSTVSSVPDDENPSSTVNSSATDTDNLPSGAQDTPSSEIQSSGATDSSSNTVSDTSPNEVSSGDVTSKADDASSQEDSNG